MLVSMEEEPRIEVFYYPGAKFLGNRQRYKFRAQETSASTARRAFLVSIGSVYGRLSF